ncbi:Disease resistance protein RPP8 [Rhynchospora pubera]|uniref:Disease resistance protein RPP8 n=1 Tax=Rhynchospora pubera TaxID=906938 RepID=A0AAV8CS68_9POAL|nr:Disease resistance protein RPP8 [Rhynchospora pubera]
MGGLGKTTLAQKVYKSNELERHFPCRIWLSISQKFDVHNLLREILYSVEPNLRNENPTIRQEDLRTKLRESLTQQRYLIVLDDVWSIGLWESLRTTLPDEKNASRVLITTRIVDVARAADGDSTPHELRHLNENESLTLLFQKANIPIGESGVQFRTDLNDVARQLTKKCAYLPLALIVLGSILSRRERTKDAWQRVHETLDWHDEATKRCSEVLLLSYVELPYHLKPCFLYFASFPEDYEISAKHVIRMWIAEGFKPRGGHGTMEEKAQNFLEELLQRSLFQVIKKSWDGKCKTCRVHDLVREMAIQEAREENFFTVFTKEDDEIQFSAQKVRRAMLQCNPPTNFGIHSKKNTFFAHIWAI